MTRITVAIFLFAFSLIINANDSLKSTHQISIQSNVSIEHSGRTDKDGCHKERKTGTRHCH